MSYYVKKMRTQLYNILNEVLVDPNTFAGDNVWLLSDKDLQLIEQAILTNGMNIKRLDDELLMLHLVLDRKTMKLSKV